VTPDTAGAEVFVRTSVEDGVGTVTMDRPERLNALGRELRRQLTAALRSCDEDNSVRCIVLTGTGRAFSSGADFAVITPRDGSADITTWYRFGEGSYGPDTHVDPRTVHKPVIGAVNGLAYGGGLILAASCDLLVAAESARFCIIESRMGSGGSTSLPFLIGAQWTKFLMFTGEILTAQKAKEIGLVIETVPDDQLTARVHDLTHRIAAMPRHQVFFSKGETDGTLEMMGLAANERSTISHSAVVQATLPCAAVDDGRLLYDVLEQDGFRGYINARDAAFKEPLFEGE
jgi:enoyl-CoA hydratase/carnithine racemase